MSAPASDPPSNDPIKTEDTPAAASGSTSDKTSEGEDVQMKDGEKKQEEEVPVDRYEDIPEHVMSVS
jgi:hypothetical protein